MLPSAAKQHYYSYTSTFLRIIRVYYSIVEEDYQTILEHSSIQDHEYLCVKLILQEGRADRT